MATYLQVFTAPDEHIDYLQQHAEHLFAYIDGTAPVPKKEKTSWLSNLFSKQAPAVGIQIPNNWPASEVEMIGPEINHRNVDLHHWILNGQKEFVTGSGSIFQTWLTSKNKANHSAIDIGDANETFAFKAHQVPALLELVVKVNEQTLRAAFEAWLKHKEESDLPTDEDCQQMAEEYKSFADKLSVAVKNNQGIVWVS